MKIVVNTSFILLKYSFDLSRMLKRCCKNIFILIIESEMKINVGKTIILFVMINVLDNFDYYFQIWIIKRVIIFAYINQKHFVNVVNFDINYVNIDVKIIAKSKFHNIKINIMIYYKKKMINLISSFIFTIIVKLFFSIMKTKRFLY